MDDRIQIQYPITKELVNVTAADCAFVAMIYKSKWQTNSRSFATLRDLMLAGFCLLIVVGCNPCQCEPTEQTKARAAELSSGFSKTVATHMAAQKLTGEMTLENTQAIIDKLNSMEASLTAPKPKTEEVIKSALEPQKPTQATPSHTEQPVAVASAVRSSKVKMTWNIEGNWNPSILETARHLREDHGFIADGLSHQQMHDAHAAFHEGRKPVAMRAPPVQIINRGTGCPGGVCPLPQMQTRRRR